VVAASGVILPQRTQRAQSGEAATETWSVERPACAEATAGRGAWKRGGGTSGVLREPAEAFGKAMKTQRREERGEEILRSLRAIWTIAVQRSSCRRGGESAGMPRAPGGWRMKGGRAMRGGARPKGRGRGRLRIANWKLQIGNFEGAVDAGMAGRGILRALTCPSPIGCWRGEDFGGGHNPGRRSACAALRRGRLVCGTLSGFWGVALRERAGAPPIAGSSLTGALTSVSGAIVDPGAIRSGGSRLPPPRRLPLPARFQR